jgi:hypothetical protein
MKQCLIRNSVALDFMACFGAINTFDFVQRDRVYRTPPLDGSTCFSHLQLRFVSCVMFVECGMIIGINTKVECFVQSRFIWNYICQYIISRRLRIHLTNSYVEIKVTWRRILQNNLRACKFVWLSNAWEWHHAIRRLTVKLTSGRHGNGSFIGLPHDDDRWWHDDDRWCSDEIPISFSWAKLTVSNFYSVIKFQHTA